MNIKLKRNRKDRVCEKKIKGQEVLTFPNLENPSIRTYKQKLSDRYSSKLISEGLLINFEDLKKNKLNSDEIVNKIICGDSFEVLSSMPSNFVNLVITSPPYWNIVDYGFNGQYGQTTYENYLNQLLKVWKECERVLEENGKLCIQTPIMPISKKVINAQHTRHLKNINNDIEQTILTNTKMQRYSLYIWQKQTTEKMFGSYPYPPNIYEQNTIEFINVFVKGGKPKKLDKDIKESSKISVDEWMDLSMQVWPIISKDIKRKEYPAPFPESLPNRLISMYSFREYKNNQIKFPGDIVLVIHSVVYDNAITESFFHTFKTEFVYFEDFQTRKSCQLKTFDYIELFFNRERLHSALGNRTPEEFEQLEIA